MSKCMDPQIGKLLHAYELNALSEQETELFEMHVIGCDHCFESLQHFEQEAALLVSDDEVKSAVVEAAQESESATSSPGTVRHMLLPGKLPLFKTIAATALLLVFLLIATPQFLMYVARDDSDGDVQVVGLEPRTRRDIQAIALKSDARYVNFGFMCESLAPGETCRVVICRSEDSDTVLKDGYCALDTDGVVSVSVSTSKLEPGRFTLTAFKRWPDSTMVCGPFDFTVFTE